MAPSYRNDAVSASNVGSVGAGDDRGLGAAARALRRRLGPVRQVTAITGPPGRHRIGGVDGQGKGSDQSRPGVLCEERRDAVEGVVEDGH